MQSALALSAMPLEAASAAHKAQILAEALPTSSASTTRRSS